MRSPGKSQASSSVANPKVTAASSSHSFVWAGAIILGLIALFLIARQSTFFTQPSETAAQGQALGTAGSIDQLLSADAPLRSESNAVAWMMEAANPGRTRFSPATLSFPLHEQTVLGRSSSTEENGSPPIIAGTILLSEQSKELRAIDLLSGKQLWAFAEQGSYISPALAGPLVYIRVEAGNKGKLLALDLKTGKERWAFTPQRLSDSSTGYYGGHLGSPLIDNNIVYVSAGKEVYALDATTGAQRWIFASQELLTSSLAADQEALYISDFRYIYAIDRQKGTLRWAKGIAESFSFSPVISAEQVLIANGDSLVALDRSDGTQRWVFSPSGDGVTPAGSHGPLVFAKSTTVLYALDSQTGAERWRYHNPNFVSLPAITTNALMLVEGMGADSTLTALNPETGALIWQQKYASMAASSPAVVSNTVYMRMNDGRIVAFSGP